MQIVAYVNPGKYIVVVKYVLGPTLSLREDKRRRETKDNFQTIKI